MRPISSKRPDNGGIWRLFGRARCAWEGLKQGENGERPQGSQRLEKDNAESAAAARRQKNRRNLAARLLRRTTTALQTIRSSSWRLMNTQKDAGRPSWKEQKVCDKVAPLPFGNAGELNDKHRLAE